MSIHTPFLSARAAAQLLGVTLPTLYAYTSRGQLRSEPVPGRSRERRYVREDVEQLRRRKTARRDPAQAAAQGLHWGFPVLDSALTLIHAGRLYYRGRDAVGLAGEAALEDVAELLWNVESGERGRQLEQDQPLTARDLARVRGLSGGDPLIAMQMALPLANASDLGAGDLRPAAFRRAGWRVLRLFGAIVTGRTDRLPLHIALQLAWAPEEPNVADVIRRSLVLAADHELNVSTFVARCAASAGCSLYDVVAAALATLRGVRHGGSSARVGALLAEAARHGPQATITDRLRRGEHLPGFGHPLYPTGDPRATELLRLTAGASARKAVRLARELARSVETVMHEAPNLDFGLAAVARAWRLPEAAPLLLFALGRTVGWIAHAIEQLGSSELIRPRGKYVGPLPEPTPT